MALDTIYTTYPLDDGYVPSREVTFATCRGNNDRYSEKVRNTWKMEAHYMLASEILQVGDWFIDAGANIGTFSFPVAKQTGSNGIMVEALPENCRLLHSALIKNLDANVSILNAAVGKEEGEIFISGTSAYARTSDEAGKGVSVEQMTLGAVMAMVPRRHLKLLKIDIEGSELDAFEGADELLASGRIENIIYESNGPVCTDNGYSVRDLRKSLTKHGYNLFTIVGHKLVPTGPDEFQFLGNADLLATRESPEKVGTFIVTDLSDEQKKISVKQSLNDLPKQYRSFMENELKIADKKFRDDVGFKPLKKQTQTN